MGKKIIFFGGCKGVDKSNLLNRAIEIIKRGNHFANFNLIPISKEFEEFIKLDKHSLPSPTLWYKDDWKKYDKQVIDKLCTSITASGGINIINNHFSVPYMGKENYLPGLEPTSLENLLIKSFLEKGINTGKVMSGITSPCFGLLLIDPEPSLIVDYYTGKYKNVDDNVLNYLSEQMILRDLEQNRSWAYSYCDIASAVLGKEYVYRETIYITKDYLEHKGYIAIYQDIANFLQRFTR